MVPLSAFVLFWCLCFILSLMLWLLLLFKTWCSSGVQSWLPTAVFLITGGIQDTDPDLLVARMAWWTQGELGLRSLSRWFELCILPFGVSEFSTCDFCCYFNPVVPRVTRDFLFNTSMLILPSVACKLLLIIVLLFQTCPNCLYLAL